MCTCPNKPRCLSRLRYKIDTRLERLLIYPYRGTKAAPDASFLSGSAGPDESGAVGFDIGR